jgi:hypothetical protein
MVTVFVVPVDSVLVPEMVPPRAESVSPPGRVPLTREKLTADPKASVADNVIVEEETGLALTVLPLAGDDQIGGPNPSVSVLVVAIPTPFVTTTL